ncbi:MAG TPA: hypothetical protein VEU29_05040, partial [Actinomycetota bacterium]|nr:hypothetical protein [Actinomycetota bacterium]
MVSDWAGEAFAIVAGLAIVRAYLSGAARPTPEDQERARRLGGMLMLGGIAIGSTAGGTIFAERSADDPAPAVAWLALAAAGLALTSGAALRLGARGPRAVEPSAVRGRARIYSLREGAPGVHGVPVWELGLEVTAPGIAPFRTDVFAEVPHRVAETLEEGAQVAVLVEDSLSRKVTPDWTGDVEGPAAVRVAGPPLASRSSISPFGWLVRVLLPLAILALVANLSNRLFDSEERAPV